MLQLGPQCVGVALGWPGRLGTNRCCQACKGLAPIASESRWGGRVGVGTCALGRAGAGTCACACVLVLRSLVLTSLAVQVSSIAQLFNQVCRRSGREPEVLMRSCTPEWGTLLVRPCCNAGHGDVPEGSIRSPRSWHRPAGGAHDRDRTQVGGRSRHCGQALSGRPAGCGPVPSVHPTEPQP